MRRPLLFLALCVLVPAAPAQDVPVALQFLQTLTPRALGPANMSGRVTEVAVFEKQPRLQYLASASGGLWKTANNGLTWRPIFEHQASASIGAVAVHPENPDLVWVGTGEANARNSVSWGDGVYKSSDGGKTWAHLGLKETHHIGRIVLHPTDPAIAYVAALGHLWGSNPERGVFKTSDGGKTWQHSLRLDADTGCVDLAIDPHQPETLYAAAYHVRRDPFSGGNPGVQFGPTAGLYKTSDAGMTWQRLSQGLPPRPLGRCGLAVSRQHPGVVYAVVQTDLTPATTQGQSANQKLNLNKGGLFRSDDRGATWTHVNSLVPRPFYYGQVRLDPSDDRRVYVLGVSLHLSTNGGKTFGDSSAAPGTHSDHHALWIDPRDPYHLVLGNDGGLYYSYDRGAGWEHLMNLPISQFYAVAVDRRQPYRVYGGLQDNGSWGGASATRDSAGITLADWFRVMGLDGFHCQVDPQDPDIVYVEGQYGRLHRFNVRTGDDQTIRPRLATKTAAGNLVPPPLPDTADFRFNWSSPLLISPHDGRTVYYGGNHLFRSSDRGDTWAVLSPDLTRGKPGANDYAGHTLTTVTESPLRRGLVYVGTDDGRIHMTPDGGKEWLELTFNVPSLPPERWITRLECSPFAEGTVYLAVDRHRHDDRAPYLYKSTDRGQTWTSLASTLPAGGPVHVIRADPVNRELLYAGTEYGLFVSLDGGATWQREPHLPTVAVHDLVVHPRDHELVIATHGRGIYALDVHPLQQATDQVVQAPGHLFDIAPAQAYRTRTLRTLGSKTFAGQNPPYGAAIYCYFPTAPSQAPTLTISDEAGKKVVDLKIEQRAGLQRLTWRLNQPGTPAGTYRPVPAGTYLAILRAGEMLGQKRFRVDVEE